MAHHITDGMISFNGKTPWHGLGTRVEVGATPEEMLQVAKLDWTVSLRSLAVSTDCMDEETQQTRACWRSNPMAAFKGVMRSDTNECFAVPTRKYQPVQNIEIARFFHDYADATACELQVVGGLDGGRKVWALAKVGADYTVSAKAGLGDVGLGTGKGVGEDVQLGYVMLATSHDGSLRTIAMGTSVYVVCWNTMSAALGRSFSPSGKMNKDSKATFALKHNSKFDDTAKRQAISTVGLVKEQLQSTHEMAETFARVQLDSRGRIEFIRRLLNGESVLDQAINDHPDTLRAEHGSLLDAVIADDDPIPSRSTVKQPEDTRLGKTLLDAIINSPGNHLDTRANTLWGAVNGVTYYSDHERGRTPDSTLNASWFGQGANMKAQAVQVAYDMAGITRGRSN